MALPLDPLPIDAWQRDMEAAAQAICDAGKALLDHHRQVSKTADRNASDWKLGDRLQEERQSLHRIIEANQEILVRLEDLRTDLLSDSGLEKVSPEWLRETADLIEDRLQTIERELLSTRHVALDILLWAQRSGRVDGSPHPQAYRERYAALTQYSPVFKPALQAIRDALLDESHGAAASTELTQLLSVLTRYASVGDSTRAFIGNVASPTKEIVFLDTETFVEEAKALPSEERRVMVSELNDCCQYLLYEPAQFRRRTTRVDREIGDGVEVSLFELAISTGHHALFTVDDDPVFERVDVTLLRLVPSDQLAATTELLIQEITQDFAEQS